MRLRGAALLVAALAVTGCASASWTQDGGGRRLAVLTPLDGVQVRSRDALPAQPATADLTADLPADLEAARGIALLALRHDLAGALEQRGFEVVEVDRAPLTGPRPHPPALAALGGDADAVLFVQLLAYGDIRRSWLWVLGAQGLAAGIGHGLVVGAATGDSRLAWIAGSGEFLLETATWVGGALLGSRGIDPVLMRVWLVRTRDGAVLGRWTREGTRPFRHWFQRKGQPPRAERLRAVSERIFTKLARRVERRLMGKASPARR